ncbi:tumor necrosis factor receptor superfamily member 16-like isoform X2 [Anoplopoma fimbria]|uniref:tumor necrosis factor receptor superfamily member 16-like isoform X2 n=1 Tax=Anoplopoma fimbria TaxID=229290 RepID=UPI0023EC6AB3|nr:tumor necrosis factor receptor superfamily member 16-like isoform X2 [Anoplopoma fimbria]
MIKFPLLVVSILIWLLKPTQAFPGPGTGCKDGLQYTSGNICCLNCPAGTRMTSPCTRFGSQGTCEECDDGTFTGHSNDLSHCLKCMKCPSDKEIVRPCTHTQDAECQCKSGRFCAPDQPCEVCKKCSRCKNDEEIARNCTSTNNTVCKKVQPMSGSASEASVIVTLIVPLIAALIIGAIIFAVWRRRKTTDSQGNPANRLKPGEDNGDNCPTEIKSCSNLNLPRQLVRAKSSADAADECKPLCQSLNSSASNSQHSLTGLSSAFPAPPPQAIPTAPMLPDRREDVEFPKLVPVNGDESLRKCFEYFDDLDFNQHKRFFRHLGIVDNVIKSKEQLPYEDRIHDLLTVWVEKEGREASLNNLLKALLDLNQRRTAETVKEKAIHNGHYDVQY